MLRLLSVALVLVLATVATNVTGDNHEYEVTVEQLLDRAESGDIRAAFILGSRFAARNGAEDEEAVRWFRRAAEGGLAEAQYNLGTMYLMGRGVARDDAEALRWLQLAARKGMAEAQFNVGTLYASGRGVVRDEAVAATWFEQAAIQGLPEAQLNLGLMYEYGRGVPKDLDKALAWYTKADSQGYATAGDRAQALRAGRVGASQSSAEATPSLPAKTSSAAVASALDAGDGDNQWVAAQDPNAFTLQLASFQQPADAARFIRSELGEREAHVYVASKRGGRWYSVVLGRFASAQQANDAVAQLPQKVRKAKPWVRRFGAIQAEIKQR